MKPESCSTTVSTYAAGKQRAPRNRTLVLSESEGIYYPNQLLRPPLPQNAGQLSNWIVCGDAIAICHELPKEFVDLLILDPPYNLTKKFGAETFREMTLADYEKWFEEWFAKMLPTLKHTATIYVCGDWKSSAALHRVLERHVIVRNRITWEREKGRGAKTNWKNASEDIWFCTISDDYFFDVEAVKLKRKVIAPYKENGLPKDWEETHEGDFRLTHPSNLWTDLTVPFWSMPENTDHPTQKPEKLIAKLVLASSRAGDFVFDPFLGSGTSAVVAKKLNRVFLGIELNEAYACLAAKRVKLAELDKSIQGYSGGVFWERNTLNMQSREEKTNLSLQPTLFESPTPYKIRKKHQK
jgi:site-specific DNA-methyltransferase (adenine-specific)